VKYLTLPWMDSPVSVFDICQAHAQLESDYNVGGWLRERPSNKRRMEATACQLSRMQYDDPHRWVEICADDDEDCNDDNDVRDIYLFNVLKLGLPMDDEMREFVRMRYAADFLQRFPAFATPKED
jgi:hypothetical protein